MFKFLKRKKQNSPETRHLITQEDPKSPLAEAYRTIRTSMHYATADDNAKIFMFTSAGPGEGKSTTIANVAVTFAQAGTKTLLIDCDLRKPVQHKIFHISNSKGLTNLLVDKRPLTEVLTLTPNDNLQVLPSGPIPPNPSELLGSRAMQNLLASLKENYDLILIDAPPTIAVTDAPVLAGAVDGIVLILLSKAVKTDLALEAKARLEQANGKIIGAILNGLEMSSQDYSYYYYYGEKES
ncbi:CpsD/CapB family tyrosine-protein kinase [Heliorestis acidaminivorans]|uniref:non-specific protein-tyrosine kinase n=1 Tax=Heliorestis acidaminivorans TaxID=553427 RepID=A0A6I0ET25_9FIRM|nr:CpsD/CapB family tyrosine-protein kinase [Heliorestis acidaminivorans]KAB2953775.1 CpsD/CapB family tyrosine-protein kinase [Heliorestis acidaminivorans]